ncbi:MAG: hypothetical protein ACLUQB_05965 [Lachnospiraceae bacterium]
MFSTGSEDAGSVACSDGTGADGSDGVGAPVRSPVLTMPGPEARSPLPMAQG